MLNRLREAQFQLREKFLGKFFLRKGAPSLSVNPSEIAFYELLLTQCLGKLGLDRYESVLDVGCRNWSYARALRKVFPRAKLVGIEVDGNRRYWNFYRRKDAGSLFAREEKGEIFFKDFREFNSKEVPLKSNQTVLFTFFFPFVSRDPCLSWGLPERFAQFSELLTHAETLSSEWKTSFHIFSAHQGEWEADIARTHYEKKLLPFYQTTLPPNPSLWPSPHPTWIFKAGHDVVKE